MQAYFPERLAAQHTAIGELHRDRDYLLQLTNQAEEQIQTQQAQLQQAQLVILAEPF